MPAGEPADQQNAYGLPQLPSTDFLSAASFHPPDLVRISPLVHTSLELCRKGNLGNIVSA